MSAQREMERELLTLKAQLHRQAIRNDLVGLRDTAAALTPVSGLLKGAMLLFAARRSHGDSGKSKWLLRALGAGLLLMRRFRKSGSAAE